MTKLEPVEEIIAVTLEQELDALIAPSSEDDRFLVAALIDEGLTCDQVRAFLAIRFKAVS